MVFLSSRISPFTSTVIFLERRRSRPAVVTPRCYALTVLRLPAMKFTLSVRSFQKPRRPSRQPVSPSFPSDRLRGPQRVTSEAIIQLVHHGVDSVFEFQISPFTSTVIFLERSPLATAVVTSAMFAPGRLGCRP